MTKPTVAVAIFALVLALPVAPAFAQADAPGLPEEVIGITWKWVSFITPKEQIDVDMPENYTIEFAADGTAALQVDCNRGATNYVLKEDHRISFSPIAVTMMLCPDESLADRFTRELERVVTFFQQDGDFFLELPFDSGTMRFRRADAE